MDSELKQRLIGAVVVTALATIFIPMLFDEPVEPSGQEISELSVPAVPVNPNTNSANKLPTQAEQVLKARSGKLTPAPHTNEKIVETEEEAELPVSSNKPLIAEDDNAAPINNSADIADDPNAVDESEASLDTGVVAEANTTKTTTKVKPTTKTVIQAPVENIVDKTLTEEPTALEEPKITSKADLSRWAIQAGTFSQKENALALQESLRKQGLPATVETSKTNKGTPLYKIKIGPALDKKRAIAMKATLDKQNISSILIPE